MSLKKSLNVKQTNGQADGGRTLQVPEPQSQIKESRENEILDGVGRISLENEESNYVESAHWTAILDEVIISILPKSPNVLTDFQISDLKDQLDNDFVIVDPEPELEPVLGGSELPFGPCDSATKEEIIMAIPERQVVDRLVAKYFQDEVAHGMRLQSLLTD